MNNLVDVARSLFINNKGLLAADEGVNTATKRLSSVGASTSEEMRRQYRNLFLGAENVKQYLSGVILFSETLLQKGDDGKLFSESLVEKGIAPGIKVDLGTEPFPESPEELITKGLLDLPERLTEFKKQGAVFTKWRAVIGIDGDQLPTAIAIHENSKRLASYAKEVQNAGMVPILEPEVLYAGNHSRKRARAVIAQTLNTMFAILEEHSVDLESVILKTSMVLSGSESGKMDTPEEVAEDTVSVLKENVPANVAGIVFLSGGQNPDQATDNLKAITKRAKEVGAPWPLTFSYARAIQSEALAIWKGESENVEEARKAFLTRLEKVSSATL